MKYQFGEKLRNIREKKGITLKEVAAEAGVSESLVSQIERNKVSPAIDTLMKLVNFLEIDLEYLFSSFKKTKIVNLVKKNERNKIILDKLTYEQLSKTINTKDEHQIEAYYMTIDIGSASGSKEYGHNGKELGVIIEGKGEFKIGNETYQLEEGDSISFKSDVPHILKNVGDTPLKAFWVVTPPKMIFSEI